MRIAILGCGYVADMYRPTLGMHPGLELAGIHDIGRARTDTMARLTGARAGSATMAAGRAGVST